MYATVVQLISRARAYVGDSNAADKDWILDTTWEYWLTTEYHSIILRLLQAGVVGPRWVEETIDASTGTTYDLNTRVLAIGSVREVDDSGNTIRELLPLQPSQGRYATEWETEGTPQYWAAHMAYAGTDERDSNVTIELRPQPTTGSYVVRLLAEPPNLSRTLPAGSGVNLIPLAPTNAISVHLPAPAMDLMVLQAASRALTSERQRSIGLDRLVQRAEDELAHLCNARIINMPPLVRDTDARNGRLDTPSSWWWAYGGMR